MVESSLRAPLAVSVWLSHLYVCVQRLAKLRPLSVQLDQAVDVAALGRLLQAESQHGGRAAAPPHEMHVLVLGQDEVFTLHPERRTRSTGDSVKKKKKSK